VVQQLDKSGLLLGRKRALDGGSIEDTEGAAYRPAAYRTEGLFKFSGDFFNSFLIFNF